MDIPGGIGEALVCVGGLLGLYTGNLLPPSKRVKNNFKELERKKRQNQASSEEVGWVFVYKFDKIAFVLTWAFIVSGLIIFLIEKL